MRKITINIISSLLFVTFLVFFGFNSINPNQPEELIYKVSSDYQATQYAKTFDLKLISVSRSGIARFMTYENSKVDQAIDFGFVYNHLTETFRPPWQRTEDPYLKDQYALTMMQTIDAWNITVGSADVVVAIIDTGIDPNHDEFIGRISPISYNAYTETIGISAVIDDHGHGTMVAGVIGAIKDNSKGIAGIAQHIQLLVIKANRPEEGRFMDSALIEGIYYAADNGADIINLSLGGTFGNPLTEAAINYAVAKGVIVVAAAGNDGNDNLIYPAAFENVIAVSAVDQNKAIALYSNYGAHIDLAAPGSDIITTARNNGYVTASGTSFAAPQVAGVLALMKSHFNGLSPDDYITRLLAATMDAGEPGKDIYYGHGIANTYLSLVTEFVLYTFETYGAEPIEPMLILKNQPTKLPRPVLADHVFDGWYFDEAFTVAWVDHQTLPDQDATLYAKFDASFVTITFITLGTPVESIIIERGTTTELPASYLLDHRFIRWTYDEANLIPYDGEVFDADVILYAQFEAIIYASVTLYKNSVVLDQLVFETGQIITINEIAIEGYDFFGWFTDPALTIPYEPIALKEDLNLYGDYRILMLTVTFETFGGTIIEDVLIAYGDTIDPIEAIKTGYVFMDWYLDEQLSTPYVIAPITTDLTLYAKFVENAYLVTYIIDGEVYLSKYIDANQTFEPVDVMMIGYEFYGWYFDEAFEQPYVSTPIQANLILYGKQLESEHVVRFFDYDGITIFSNIMVPHGMTLTLPQGPVHPESDSFLYLFLRWDFQDDVITEDLDIYPIYQFRFKPESLTFKPGIDTLTVGQTWVDAGVKLLDDGLVVITESDIDLMTPGKYQVTYYIYQGSVLVYKAYRHIRVLEEVNDIELTLNAGIDTILVGQTHIDAGLKDFDMSQVEVINLVDTNTLGTFEIRYIVQVGGFTYERIRFVHVIEPIASHNVQDITFDMPKRKDGYDEITH